MVKISIIWLASALTYLFAGTFQASDPVFSPLYQFLSELPILIATIWLFLRLVDLHLQTMDKMVESFGQREQNQREHHKAVVDELLATIREQSKPQ